MKRTARISIAEMALAQRPGAVIEHAMRTLEQGLGGPPENIQCYSDPVSASLIIEATRSDTSQWVSSLTYSSPTNSLTYDDLKKAASDFSLYYPSLPTSRYGYTRKVYLAGSDDDYLPEEPEPMWSTEPVTGWRLFQIAGGTLVGQRSVAWPEKTLVAECDRDETNHLAPDWSCVCGIYASSYPLPDGTNPILGEVSLSGRVIEHEYGYRAERATILRLWAPKEAHRDLAKYGVPVIPMRGREI